MKIEYPIMNVSLSSWPTQILEADELIRFDDIYNSSDEEFFNKYFLNQLFVDGKGEIYKITGKIPVESFFANFFSKKKYKFEFFETNNSISFDELRSYLLDKVNKFDESPGKNMILNSINKATIIRELIEGKYD